MQIGDEWAAHETKNRTEKKSLDILPSPINHVSFQSSQAPSRPCKHLFKQLVKINPIIALSIFNSGNRGAAQLKVSPMMSGAAPALL